MANLPSSILVAASAVFMSQAPLAAQEKPATPPATPAPVAPDAQPKSEPAAGAAQPPAKQPTLDELLGLPKPKADPKAKPRPDAEDPTRSELERKLSPREVAEQFKQAVDLMGETATRLETSRDTGLATQRLQEDIIRKLDQLIKSAEQNQKQSQSSSSSSSSQREQNQNQPNQQQQQQQRDPKSKEAAPDTMEPPPGQDPRLSPGAAARGAAWGALPERLRDALLQGNADKYSSLYQKWTESYYRRLAEDANR